MNDLTQTILIIFVCVCVFFFRETHAYMPHTVLSHATQANVWRIITKSLICAARLRKTNQIDFKCCSYQFGCGKSNNKYFGKSFMFQMCWKVENLIMNYVRAHARAPMSFSRNGMERAQHPRSKVLFTHIIWSDICGWWKGRKPYII